MDKVLSRYPASRIWSNYKVDNRCRRGMMDMSTNCLQSKQEREVIEVYKKSDRIINVSLSDEDAINLLNLASVNGLTVGELIERFVKDVTLSEDSFGEDERDLARAWIDRSFVPTGDTMLKYLVDMGKIEDIGQQDFKVAYSEYVRDCFGEPEPYTQAVQAVKNYQYEYDKFIKRGKR